MKNLSLTFFSLINFIMPLAAGELLTLNGREATFPEQTAAQIQAATDALTTAVEQHDAATALRALEQGAQAESISLLFPAHTDDAALLQLLVKERQKKQISLDDQDTNGHSALYRACANGHAENAEFLLNAGASPFLTVSKTDFFNTTRDTALNVACRKCPRSTVELLLAKGGHRLVNTTNEHGRTCLHDLCREQDINTDTLALLLTAGGDANLQDNEGNTAWHYACGAKKNKPAQKRALELLMQNGANTTLLNNEGLKARPIGFFLDITNLSVLDAFSAEAKAAKREARKAAAAALATVAELSKSAQKVLCSICMGDEEEKNERAHITLVCNHSQHRNCLENWFAAQQGRRLPPSCPLCRSTDLTEKK